jgi:hypothetical protein
MVWNKDLFGVKAIRAFAQQIVDEFPKDDAAQKPTRALTLDPSGPLPESA